MAATTIEEFRNSKKIVVKDADWCEENRTGSLNQRVAEYDGGCFIFVEDAGNFSLVIGNQEYDSTDIGELEEILFPWYLSEIVGIPDAP